MKRVTLLLILLPILWSCTEDDGIRIDPSDQTAFFRFEVIDFFDGEDLLNPELDDFSETPIRILYNEKEYPLTAAGEEKTTPAFTLHAGTAEAQGYLLFGPFDYRDEIVDQSFTIDWDCASPDDIVRFSLGYEWSGHAALLHPRMQVNDEPEKSSWHHTFTKEFPIWDFINYSVALFVQDTEGNDLLDPDFEGNILTQDIKALYREQTYPRYQNAGLYLWEDALPDQTRETLPLQLGLRWGRSGLMHDGPYCVAFGEFAPYGYHDESFTLDWGDGTTTLLTFDCYTTWQGWSPTVVRQLEVNGNDQGTDWRVTIVRENDSDTPEEEPEEENPETTE